VCLPHTPIRRTHPDASDNNPEKSGFLLPVRVSASYVQPNNSSANLNMRNTIRFPHLLRAPVFDGLTDDFKTSFIDGCLVRDYEEATPMLTQGEPVQAMFLIAHGSVEVTSINAEGQAVLIHLYRQGEVFGEVETLAERPAAGNCVAATKTTALLCPAPQLQDAMATTEFMRKIMSLSHERLVRDNQVRFVDQFYPVEQRPCDYLYRLSADRPRIAKTQADLAGLLGCARQTLNRELGRLRDRKVIEIEKGRIVVLDRPGLWQRAHRGEVGTRTRL